MERLPFALLLTVALMLPGRAAASSPPEPLVPVVIGTEHKLHSQLLKEERPYLVAVPEGYYDSTTTRFPVLYLLDGDAHFHHVTGIVRFLAEQSRMPKVIVVGVSNTQRTRDLTPPAQGDNVPAGAGGADTFLRFLDEELAPVIEARYRTQPYRVLVGHSFGGLFAVHVLMNQPQRFNAYVAISPSLWWSGGALVKGAVKSLERLPAKERWLYMTMGSEGDDMLGPIQELARTLEKAKPARLAWRYSFLEKEHHGSTPHRSIYDGLEAIFSGWDVPPALLQSGDAAALEAHYAAMTERFGFEVRPPEATLNFMGYQLLRKGQSAAALAIFRKNVALYGELSSNVHDSLGEALEAAGKKDEAAASYLRAWRLGTERGHHNVPAYKRNLDRVLGKTPEAKKAP
ncbi:MAG TPA: alpha/beta hydrolase-fold protein [Myxococcus sp.]|nr:alpha/beta hydrolase-fold protein [Myxococcus sp.]